MPDPFPIFVKRIVLQPPHIDQKKTVYPVISNRSILT